MKKLLALVFALICIITLAGCSDEKPTLFDYDSLKNECEENRSTPRIDINTFGKQIKSKEVYIDCTISISGTEIEEYSAGIRGRGNSTWGLPKNPYRIKFDEKVSVFGESKNKSWVLLALYGDYSAVKDKLAFKMADAIGTDVFVPSYHYVELYLNGLYQGLYLLTDQVDENSGRTDVKEKFTAEDVAVPFLVELDAYAPDEGVEGVDWFRIDGNEYAIKYPEVDERYTEEQFEYIKQYIIDVDNACKEGSLEKLAALVDIDSFIDYYIVQEAMGQAEINGKSVYMYKTKDGLMKMGPLWDFDWSAMGSSIGKHRDINKDKIEGFYSDGNWFDLMLKKSSEFKALVSERFHEVKPMLLSAIEDTRKEYEIFEPYYKRNHLRWHWFRVWSNQEEYYHKVLDWCTARIEWLDTALPTIKSIKGIDGAVKIEITKYDIGKKIGSVTVTEEGKVKHIVDNLNSLKLKELKYNEPTAIEYELVFYNSNGETMRTISITLDGWVDYGTFNSVVSGKLDREYIAGLFD